MEFYFLEQSEQTEKEQVEVAEVEKERVKEEANAVNGEEEKNSGMPENDDFIRGESSSETREIPEGSMCEIIRQRSSIAVKATNTPLLNHINCFFFER